MGQTLPLKLSSDQFLDCWDTSFQTRCNRCRYPALSLSVNAIKDSKQSLPCATYKYSVEDNFTMTIPSMIGKFLLTEDFVAVMDVAKLQGLPKSSPNIKITRRLASFKIFAQQIIR